MLPSSSFQKLDLCVSLLFAHVLEVDIQTLNAHLNAFQEAGGHPLRGICWHFTHIVTARRYDATPPRYRGLVAVSSGLLTVLISTRWAILVLGSLQGLPKFTFGSVYRNKSRSLEELRAWASQR